MGSLKANEMMMKTMTKPPLRPAYNAKPIHGGKDA
jgi:hypothetical protein